jgi:hypothetical protein
MPALVALANTTLSVASTTITFSSISQSYQDLYLVVIGKCSGGFQQNIRFNGDTGANYSMTRLYGSPPTTISSGTSAGATRGYISWLTFNSSVNSAAYVHILDYARTDKHKTTVGDATSNNGTETALITNRWASTAAITSVALSSDGGQTYSAGTTFALYGVTG